MLEPLVAALAWLGRFSDPLAWVVVAAFLLGGVLEWRDLPGARVVTAAAWVLFAAFWVTVFHHFAFVQKSFVEGIGILIAIPGTLYAGHLLWRGRDSLFVLSRAIGIMGVIYLPFIAIDPLGIWLAEVVTRQTTFLMELLGQTNPEDYRIVNGARFDNPDGRNTFLFYLPEENHRIFYTILIACTGIGSISIFGGGILAVKAPLRRKAKALAVAVPVIYGLNLVRNVFIALAFGQQRMDYFPELIMTLFAAEDRYHVSFYIADRIIAQVGAVLVLIGLTYVVARQVPEVLVYLEDVLYMLTGTEYDLQEELGLEPPEPRDPGVDAPSAGD